MSKLVFAVIMALLGWQQAYAGEAKITWQDPDNYADIRPSDETRDGFRARVFKSLDEVFQDLAKQLPDGVSWEIVVTDLDLAGDVRPMMRGTMNEIRIIKDIYWPRMSIRYVMRDASGKLIAEGQDDIKDMNFMMGSNFLNGNSSFQYEEKMLRDWFRKQQRDQKFPTR